VISGDANADGRVDIDDLLLLMDWLDGAPARASLAGDARVSGKRREQGFAPSTWNDFFLYLDKLGGVHRESFRIQTPAHFPFAGYDWLTVRSFHLHGAEHLQFRSRRTMWRTRRRRWGSTRHDEYVFRGVKTSASLSRRIPWCIR
jgi:hypothetical protein